MPLIISFRKKAWILSSILLLICGSTIKAQDTSNDWKQITVKIPTSMVGYVPDPSKEHDGAVFYTFSGQVYQNGTGVVDPTTAVTNGVCSSPMQLLATYLNAAKTPDLSTIRSLYITSAQPTFDDSSVTDKLKTALPAIDKLELLISYKADKDIYLFVKQTDKAQAQPSVMPIPTQMENASWRLAIETIDDPFIVNMILALPAYPLSTLIVSIK